MSGDGLKLTKATNDPLSETSDPNKKEWVKFEEDGDNFSTQTNGAQVFFLLLGFCLIVNHLKVTTIF
jgi:hypothetical protein